MKFKKKYKIEKAVILLKEGGMDARFRGHDGAGGQDGVGGLDGATRDDFLDGRWFRSRGFWLFRFGLGQGV